MPLKPNFDVSVVLPLDERGRALLSPEAACDVLDCSMSKLYRLMNSGALEFVHLGGRTKIPVDGVAKLIDALRAKSPRMRERPWDMERTQGIAERRRSRAT